MFNQADYAQISNKGMDLHVVLKQIDHFIAGFPFVRLDRPAIQGDGILKFSDTELNNFTSYFESRLPGLKVVKFVPASGAASRMFKHLFEFRNNLTSAGEANSLDLHDQDFNSVQYFISHLKQVAFFADLEAVVSKTGKTVHQLLETGEYGALIDSILSEQGLNYANLPKALLKFHQYQDGSRTAAEEHLVEAAVYTRDRDNTSRIHFTISPEHLEKFRELLIAVQERYEKLFGVKFDISFSIQKPSTDTIAVDESNQPVRNADGTLLFRPGGHGALLENLNEVDADLIFIKNIDNIVPDRLKSTTFQYKKALAGYLLVLKQEISGYLTLLRNNQPDQEELNAIIRYAKEKLCLDMPANLASLPLSDKVNTLINMLDRPIRVCGMVRNEGEPGGGPFWVKGEDQQCSLQIVESSQVNLKDPEQKHILDQSSHFNPVDLVCCTTDVSGKPFDLKEFVDENTGFISLKSSGGKTIKAQELPGLWNGAMAKWITIFVEVPIITFNPVKTVNDLLRSEHRSS